MDNLWKPYNANPHKKRNGDCTARAICKATGKTWDQVYIALCAYGFSEKDYPSANIIWGQYLYDLGFRQHLIERYWAHTVEDFCREHPNGTYILAIDGHVVCAVDGYYWDSWDSGQEIPVYYWTREGK